MSSADVWYEDSGTGEIYQERIDSKGRRVRVYRKDSRETTSSRAELSSNRPDSRTPRSRRDSVYSSASIEGSTSRIYSERAKSKIRDPARADDTKQAPYQDNPSQPYTQVDPRGVVGEPTSTAYQETYDSRRQISRDYYPRGGYDRPDDHQEYAPTRTRDFAAAGPSAIDSLTHRVEALRIPEDENYVWDDSQQHPSIYESRQIDSTEPPYTTPGYHPQPPNAQPSSAAEGQPRTPNRHIRGTKGDSERFDPSYSIRKNDYKKFFRVGRVFSTLWTDALGGNADRVNPTFISEVIYKQKVYSKVRRFVVVRQGERSVTCLPVTSYDGAGYRKKGINLYEHGFIYSKNIPRKNEDMQSRPLKVNLSRGAAALQDPSLVNYGKVYTVETNVKVKDVGELDSDSRNVLLHYFRKVFSVSGVEGDLSGADVTPRAAGADLVGVGAAMQNYTPPAEPSAYSPATTYSGYATIPAGSGYPPPGTGTYGDTPGIYGDPPGSRGDPPSGQGGYAPPYSLDTGYQRLPSAYDTNPVYQSPPNPGPSYTTPASAGQAYSSYPSAEYSGQYSSGSVAPYTVSYAEGRAPSSSTYGSRDQRYYAQQPYPPVSSQAGGGAEYQTRSQDPYARPTDYQDPASRDDDDIDLPSLETARQDQAKRRGSRSDRRHKKR